MSGGPTAPPVSERARTIDINCDLGEGMATDAEVLPFISSASIACGLHAGGPDTMVATLAAARGAGVAVGAHPGLPDRAGFGRRPMPLSPAEIAEVVAYQLGAFGLLAARLGLRPAHLKLHGALYHQAAQDPAVAAAVTEVAAQVSRDLVVIGLAGSALEGAARKEGLRFAAELFADRQYQVDGSLVPRTERGAVLAGSPAQIAQRAVAMIEQGGVVGVGGAFVPAVGQTLCLHGDQPDVVEKARALRTAVEAAGFRVQPLAEWVDRAD